MSALTKITKAKIYEDYTGAPNPSEQWISLTVKTENANGWYTAAVGLESDRERLQQKANSLVGKDVDFLSLQYHPSATYFG